MIHRTSLLTAAACCLLLAACASKPAAEGDTANAPAAAPVEDALNSNAATTPAPDGGSTQGTSLAPLSAQPAATAAATAPANFVLTGNGWKGKLVGNKLHLDELPKADGPQLRPVEVRAAGEGALEATGMEENGHPFTLRILPLACKGTDGKQYTYTVKLERTLSSHIGCAAPR